MITILAEVPRYLIAKYCLSLLKSTYVSVNVVFDNVKSLRVLNDESLRVLNE